MIHRTLLPMFAGLTLMSAIFGGCSTEPEQPSDTPVEADAERGKLGKADLWGSCAYDTFDYDHNPVEKNHCGERSNGTCYCDEKCSVYEDCCDDYEQVCATSACGEGMKECPGCNGTTFCSSAQHSCPKLACPQACEQLDETQCNDRQDCHSEYGASCDFCQDYTFQGCHTNPSCDQLDESSCNARQDCEPEYGASCDLCQDWSYQGCHVAPCEALNLATCKARQDCMPLWGASCDLCQDWSYQGCYTLGEEPGL